MKALLTKNVWAVGSNYVQHIKEMQSKELTEIPTEPYFFLKPGSSIELGSKIKLPTWSTNLHHEIEIALWIDENLNFSHVSLALDLTARDVQKLAKSKGLPWTLAKSFTGACPLGSWVSLTDISSFDTLTFELVKNGLLTQIGHANDMLFKPKQLLEYLKIHFPLSPYDVLLTGTPAGVGPLQAGDSLEATLRSEGHKILACHWDVI